MNNTSLLLAIDWANAGTKAAQLILSLSLIVIVHEFGHYLPSKLFKCRVEKFFLFFDPWFALVKKKIGDTVYGIGWLPLGGYVKISGMVDESMDKEQMRQPAATLGIQKQTGLAASDYYGRRRDDECTAGFLYICNDSLYLGSEKIAHRRVSAMVWK